MVLSCPVVLSGGPVPAIDRCGAGEPARSKRRNIDFRRGAAVAPACRRPAGVDDHRWNAAAGDASPSRLLRREVSVTRSQGRVETGGDH